MSFGIGRNPKNRGRLPVEEEVLGVRIIGRIYRALPTDDFLRVGPQRFFSRICRSLVCYPKNTTVCCMHRGGAPHLKAGDGDYEGWRFINRRATLTRFVELCGLPRHQQGISLSNIKFSRGVEKDSYWKKLGK